MDETVIKGQDVQFSCILAEKYTGLIVNWELNNKSLKRENAFISSGKNCILKIQNVCPQLDEGIYTCQLTLPNGSVANTSAKLTILGPPLCPTKPTVQQITSTSVSLSWKSPSFNGHSPITVYLIECKDTQGDKYI